MANSYKALKEDFVSNLSGGSIGEINIVTTVAPAAVLLWSVLQTRHSFFAESSLASHLTDFFLNVGCILVGTTIYARSALALVVILLASSLVYYLVPSNQASPKSARTPSKPKKDAAAQADELSPFPVRPFLTAYRGTMLVVTCTSILAVDFNVFPRRFAKVETWGTSLMDLGVGSFVFSAGVVAAKSALRERLSGKSQSIAARAIGSIRTALPLIVLGGARLLSVKNLDYAEHVSEYGVHWNFFFTMAIVPLALAFLQPLIELVPGPRYALAGLATTVLHQLALWQGLQIWALSAPRVGVLSQNREGITSSPGYLAVFLFGMSAGTLVIPRVPDSSKLVAGLLDRVGLAESRKQTRSSSWAAAQDTRRVRLLVTLALSATAFSALLMVFQLPRILPVLVNGVSRRLANMPYVLWVAAFNCAQLAAFCMVETALFPGVRRARTTEAENAEASRATSPLLNAYNSGGLLLFLAANLGTGAVNLGIDTLRTGDTAAVMVLTIYMALLTVLVFNLRGVKLKL